MVYTVTFNPAIDYVVRTEGLALGEVNRARGEQLFFGGKGINVSAVLSELGVATRALGFTAGFTGEAIEQGLAAAGIETDFIRLPAGNSRINVKIKAAEETELNGCGPDIDSGSLEKLFKKLDGLQGGDVLVLAGSIPPSLPSDVYERILARLSGREIRAVVDATGDLLLNVLKYRPFLIKPNDHELGALFGVALEGMADIEKYARRLRELGARNVLVSMAGDGALLVDEQGLVHTCGVCRGEVRNSVGAGDSMVAGFVAGVLMQEDYGFALKLGTAAGGATAFSDGLATKKKIDELLKQL
ncbi:MAG: 1-phosphofructokinase [Ruminococcus sp.]|nr:1-phosphofructokinase [Ruminococcus sp.]